MNVAMPLYFAKLMNCSKLALLPLLCLHCHDNNNIDSFYYLNLHLNVLRYLHCTTSICSIAAALHDRLVLNITLTLIPNSKPNPIPNRKCLFGFLCCAECEPKAKPGLSLRGSQ